MNQSVSPLALARLMFCVPFVIMLVLMLIEASLSAATTYLVIEAGRDVAKGIFLLADLMWILAAQSALRAQVQYTADRDNIRPKIDTCLGLT